MRRIWYGKIFIIIVVDLDLFKYIMVKDFSYF